MPRTEIWIQAVPVVEFLESVHRLDEGRAKCRSRSAGRSSSQPYQIPRWERDAGRLTTDGSIASRNWVGRLAWWPGNP